MEMADLHTHTSFCDGADSVEALAEAAAKKGLRALGISSHGYTPYEPDACLTPSTEAAYCAAVRAARERYAGRMEVYLGVEDDYHGERPSFARDYTIGSVHCVEVDGRYLAVDWKPSILEKAIETGFGGDPYRLTRAYYETVAHVLERTQCDFIGHFDLVAKFNEGGRYFDESDPRYLGPALEAIEHLCRQGAVFEINTGAMSRGWRSVPYPIEPMLRAIRGFGGAIVLSSDSHEAATLCAHFGEAAALARHCGFETARVLTPGGWREAPLNGGRAVEGRS